VARPGIGIYMVIPRGQGEVADVFISVGAHYCAKQAKSSVLARPIRSCRNSAHRTHACLLLVAIDRLHLPEYVIHSVKCL
jgi:hypothetical protein